MLEQEKTVLIPGAEVAERPLHIAICEDNHNDREVLLSHIHVSNFCVRYDLFKTSEELLDVFKPDTYDLVFMDIFLAGMKGIDAAALLRQQDKNVVLVFCTSSLEYALESYRLGALKYIEKPTSFNDVKEALELAQANLQTKDAITLMVSGKETKFILNDILYFETIEHAVFVHCAHDTIKTSQKVRLDDIEAMVPHPQFCRCHRSFIVNFQHVRCFDGPDFVMENNDKVYVRLKDASKVKKEYEQYVLSWVRSKTSFTDAARGQ